MSTTLPGVNVLIEGPTGTGKTYSIGTLVDTGLEVFYLACEPGIESLYAYWTDRGLPVPSNLHTHYVAAAAAGFKELITNARKINTSSLETLSKMQDPDRAKHDLFIKTYEVFNDFIDERTGESFGSVDTWGTDRVLVVDPLTGLNRAAMNLVVGGKPVKSQSDWGIAMDQLEKMILQLTDGCRCHFVLLAHIERETDQVLGGSKITVATIGQKLAPKIPPMFSDVILAQREGSTFTWSTIHPQADLKTRNLPLSDKIKPDFGQIIAKWRSRQEV